MACFTRSKKSHELHIIYYLFYCKVILKRYTFLHVINCFCIFMYFNNYTLRYSAANFKLGKLFIKCNVCEL